MSSNHRKSLTFPSLSLPLSFLPPLFSHHLLAFYHSLSHSLLKFLSLSLSLNRRKDRTRLILACAIVHICRFLPFVIEYYDRRNEFQIHSVWLKRWYEKAAKKRRRYYFRRYTCCSAAGLLTQEWYIKAKPGKVFTTDDEKFCFPLNFAISLLCFSEVLDKYLITMHLCCAAIYILFISPWYTNNNYAYAIQFGRPPIIA